MKTEAEKKPTNLVLDDAIVLATNSHSGMKRKGTNIPYIVHPMEAAAIVAGMTDDENVIAAAVLHDVVEDTALSIEDIQIKFGGIVAKLVNSESENKRKNELPENTWKIRKQETLDFLNTKATIEEKMIALGDKLSNVRAIYRDYLEIGDQLWDRFNQKDKKEQAWYYQEVAVALKELGQYPAWKEYNHLVTHIFSSMTQRERL